MTWIYTSDTT